MAYLDLTKQILKKSVPNNHKIKYNNKIFIDNISNKKYIVDNKHVKFEPSKKEIEIANWMNKILGGQLELNPKILETPNIKVPDYYYNGMRLDLKEIKGNGKNTIDTAIKSKKEQTDNFILDISEKCALSNKEIIEQIQKNIFF